MCVSSDSVIMIVSTFSMEMTGKDNSVHMVHKIKKSPARDWKKRMWRWRAA